MADENITDQTSQVEEPDVEEASEEEEGVSELDAFHLAGKGNEALDDGRAQDDASADDDGDDLIRNANVQTGRRETFESVVEGQVDQGGTLGADQDVVQDQVAGSEADNTVESVFQAPPVAMGDQVELTAADDTADAGVAAPASADIARDEAPSGQVAEAVAPEEVGAAAPESVLLQAENVTGSVEPAVETADVPVDQPVFQAQAPVLAAGASAGLEDQAIKLNLNVVLNDTDGGSETLSVRISGVPDGVTFVDQNGNPVGVYSPGDGSWTFTGSEVNDLYLERPENYSGDFTLSVTATSTEGNGSTSTVSATVPVHVEAVADAPTLEAAASQGGEDSWITLSIDTSLVDTDGSESASVYITDVPDGAQLNHGVRLSSAVVLEDGTTFPAGTWVVSPAGLADLKIQPPANSDADFSINVYSASTESSNGDVAVTGPAAIAVRVDAVADAPTLDVSAAQGNEDTWISLSIDTALVDADGSESAMVYITDIPDGVPLNHGTQLTEAVTLENGTTFPAGTWVVSPSELGDLKLLPTSNNDADFSINVYSVTTEGENGDVAVTGPAAIAVTVAAVADAPTLDVVSAAQGNEDTWIPLSIDTALVDADGSESASVYITNLPDGAQLNHGTQLTTSVTLENGTTFPAGTWVVASGDVGSLQVLPGLHSDVDFSINVYSVTTEGENGDVAVTGPAAIAVSVDAVADAPTLDASAAQGNEDTWIPLSIDTPLVDADGSETAMVYITDVPDGVPLNHGTQLTEAVTLENGTSFPAGTWVVSPSELGDLKLLPTSNSDADFSINVYSVTTEGENGDVAVTGPAAIAVTVDAVADAPTLDVSAAQGNEDTWIPLSIDTALVDADGSETAMVYITDVPDGVPLNHGTQLTEAVTLENGTSFPAGTWVVSPSELGDLKLLPTSNSDEDFSINVYSVTTEGENGDVAVTGPAAIAVTVDAVADAVTLTVADSAGMEHGSDAAATDGWIDLSISAGLTDTDGSEGQVVYIEVPKGASLSAGVALADGDTVTLSGASGTTSLANGSDTVVWAVSPADLPDLQIRPASNDSADLTLKVTSVATEADNGDQSWDQGTIHVDVGVLTPDVSQAGSLSGNENSRIELTGMVVDVKAENGDESVSVVLTGLDPDVQVTYVDANGDRQVLSPDVDGNYNVTDFYDTGSNSVDGLSVEWKTADKSDDISFNLKVDVADVDATTPGGDKDGLGTVAPDVATSSYYFAVTVNPTIGASATLGGSDSGVEDNGTPNVLGDGVAIHPTITVHDRDHSENITGTVDLVFAASQMNSIGRLTGGELYLHGIQLESSIDADGNLVYHVPASAFSSDTAGDATTYSISGLVFVPAENWSGDLSYGIMASVMDSGVIAGEISGTGSIHIEGVADMVTPTVSNAGGREDTAISLSIAASLVDTDGSESLSVYVTGVPSDAVLNHGIKLTSAVTLEDGTTFAAGTWVVSQSGLGGLTVTPGAGHSQDFALTVYGVTTESNGDVAVSAGQSLFVDVGVYAPELHVASELVMDEQTVGRGTGWQKFDATELGAVATHADGTEVLNLNIGVPAGVQIGVWSGTTWVVLTPKSSDATYSYYTVNSAYFGNIGLKTTANVDTDFTIKVRAMVGDSDLSTSHANAIDSGLLQDGATTAWQDVHVTVNAVADTLSQLSGSGVGLEDQWVGLNMNAYLRDSSESFSSIILSNVPAGSLLAIHATSGQYAGQVFYINPISTNADGTLNFDLTSYRDRIEVWTGIKLLPPANSDADFDLKLTVVSKDNATDGDTAAGSLATNTQETSIHVTVYGDADAETNVLANVSATVNEDQMHTLALQASDLSWPDMDGSETHKIWVVPDSSDVSVAVLKINGVSQTLVAATSTTPAHWEVSLSDLGKITVGGVANWASSSSNPELTFKILAVSTESDASSSASDLSSSLLALRDTVAYTEVQTVSLTVNAAADSLTITGSASGNEDTAIAFTPKITLKDTDGSEALSGNVYIVTSDADMLDGVVKSGSTALVAYEVTGYDAAGNPVLNMANSYDKGETGTFAYVVPASSFSKSGNAYSPATASRLTFTPASNSDADATYKVIATSSDTSGASTLVTTSSTLTLTVKAVADAPAVALHDVSASDVTTVTQTGASTWAVSGTEDHYIPLGITSALTDTDGSESLNSAQLSGIPSGWQVGYWDGTTFQPLTISSSGVVVISDISRIGQVALLPPTDYNTSTAAERPTITLQVTSTEAASGSQVTTASATTTVNFTVDVQADADTPSLVVTSTHAVEDTDVKLSISAHTTDSDVQHGRVASETITVEVSGDLKGGILVDSSGHELAWNSSHTAYVIAQADLDNVYFRPAADFNTLGSANYLKLTVTAIATEASNGDTATTTSTLVIDVGGRADQATYNGVLLDADGNGKADSALVVDATQTVNGIEVAAREGADSDTLIINPHFEKFTSTDIDASVGRTASETVSLVIHDIADGVTVSMTAGNEQYLHFIGYDSHGKARWSVEAGHLDDVRVTVADSDFSGDLTNAMKVDVIVSENDSDIRTVTDQSITLHIEAATDSPDIVIQNTAVTEDSTLGANGQALAATVVVTPEDIANGAESISGVTVTFDADNLHVPAGTVLTVTLDGQSYDITAGSGAILSIPVSASYLAAHTNSASHAVSVAVTLTGVPENWSSDVPFSVTATATEAGGGTATVTSSGEFAILASVDDSLVSASTVDLGTAGQIGLTLGVGSADTDGSEALDYYVVRVNSDDRDSVVLNHGINVGHGVWIVREDDLSGLRLSSNVGAEGTLTITAVVSDTDAWNSQDVDTKSFSSTIAFSIDGVSGGGGGTPFVPPEATVHVVAGTEDTSFALSVELTYAGGTDATDLHSSVVIHDLNGATIQGTLNVDYFMVDNGSGGFDYVIPVERLSAVTFLPPEDLSGQFTMDVSMTSTAGSISITDDVGTVAVADLTPVADGPDMAFGATTVAEDHTVDFPITLTQTDADASEVLTSGVVVINAHDLHTQGATLSFAGHDISSYYNSSSGLYEIPVSAFGASAATYATVGGSLVLTGLSITPATNYSGTLSATVTVNVTDSNPDGTVTVSKDFSSTYSVEVTPVVDQPVLTVSPIHAVEDQQINLVINAYDSDALGLSNGSEYVTVVIDKIPAGTLVFGATNNGSYVGEDGKTYSSWTVNDDNINHTTGEVSGVYIYAPQNSADGFTLSVSAYAMEGETGETRVVTAPLTIDLSAEADPVTISPVSIEAGAGAREDSQVAISLNIQQWDTDGSESLSVVIGNVPAGASFTDGHGNVLGTATAAGWLLSSEDLAAASATGNHLSFVGPANFSGTINLTAEAFSTDGTDVSSSGVSSFHITLLGQADTPTLTIADTSLNVNEDTGINLGLSGALADADSETMSLIISSHDVPAGTTFDNATLSADGTYWTVSQDNIDKVVMHTPQDWNGDVNLSIQLVSSEDGTTASVTQMMTVTVDPVNDAPVVDVTTAAAYSTSTSDPLYVIPQVAGTDSVTFSDVDGSATLTHLDVSITSGAQSGDALSITGYPVTVDPLTGHLSVSVDDTTFAVSYDSATRTLSFDGAGDTSSFAKLAEAVVLTNSNGEVVEGNRDITVAAYDDGGLHGSDSTTVSIGNLTDSTVSSLTLGSDQAGDVLWGSSGTATLMGGTGEDSLVIDFGDPLTTTSGGTSGFDQLYIMPASENAHASWTEISAIDAQGDLVGQSMDFGDFVINLSQPETAHVDGSSLVFADDASGSITFHDGHVVDFSDLDKITIA